MAYGLLVEQSATTDEYKDLLDAGSTDVARVPEELQELALSVLCDSANSAMQTGEHIVLVPFPTSDAGTPQLMLNLLLQSRARLSPELQQHVSVLPLLSRAEAVSQRSGLSRADRPADALQQLSTLVAARGVKLPAGRVAFLIVDDLVHEGVSLNDGTYTAYI